jgi:eukaryotic-like serine/threonine-protein kinase
MPADPTPTAGPVGATVAEPTVTPLSPPGYELREEIGRGGMGVVYRARDTALGRDVAVKLLSQRYPADSPAAQRFLGEARITGQLQHPGIPAVHQVGALADGRPFLAMKLIKGSTLEDILKHRPDPAAERGRLLAVFEAVCQAVGYAHAHRVIHRDLKPANVMVGAFGEVQVMDWGLAKVLGEEAPAAAEALAAEQTRAWTQVSPTPEAGSHTQAGSLVGTPAFIAPEQALGEIDKVNERADVFGLGALLAVVLTGQPPYVGESSEAVRVQAARGKLDDCFARLGASGAEPELVALCQKCLAFEPADRPADAGAVAAAVAGLRAAADERARRAELERVRVEGERAVAVAREAEQRKRRKVQLALAAAVLGLLLCGGAFAWWRNAQAQAGRERDARNAAAVAALLGQAEEALKAGDAAKAAVALEAARKRSAEGGAEQDAERLRRLDADLTVVRDLDAIDQFRWTTGSGNKFPDAADVAARTREALARFGADPDAVSADDAAARVSASVVRERIVAALDRLLRIQKTAAVRTLLRRVDADAYRDAVRDAVLANDRAKVAQLAGQQAALEQPAGFVAFLGESQAIEVQRRRQLLQAAVRRRSGDLGLLMALGGAYQQEAADEQLRWYQAAVAAAPGNAAAHNNLGYALANKGQPDEAIACWKKAVELDPKNIMAHSNLVNALKGKDQLDAAIASYRKAIELDPKDALASSNLALAYMRVAAPQAWYGQDKELAATCARALEFAKDTKDPTTAERVAKICSLRQSDPGTHEAALVLARRAVELGKGYPFLGFFQLALGMAEYRSGHYAAADAALPPVVRLGSSNFRSASDTAAFYRAMSLFRQGKKDEARKLALAVAVKMKPLPKDQQNPLANSANHDDLILWLAYKEAKALIKFEEKSGAGPATGNGAAREK